LRAGGGGGGAAADSGPALKQAAQAKLEAMTNLDNALANINTVDDAKKAAKQIEDLFNRVAETVTAEKAARKHAMPEDEKDVDAIYRPKLAGVENGVGMKVDDFNRRFPAAQDFAKVTADGRSKVQAAQDAVDQSGDVEILATTPVGGTWMVWLLILLVIAACVGFLFQDGIWGNCLRLVNVLFAGLLTMNFYEPVAKFLTRPGDYMSALKYDDMQTFTAFYDFLAFWICFVFFAAIMIAITDAVSKVRVRFLQVADRAGGIVMSLIIGWVMSGIVITSLHLAPLAEYPLLGCFQPQSSMFLGFLAPDREWLGFTRYQSKYGYSRGYEASVFPDSGDQNFIDKHHKRRIEIERYVRGNAEHSIRVNSQFIKK
jgi:uncharacterized membrane protein required for colicin V production